MESNRMTKRLAALLLAALLLCLSACEKELPFGGLLTTEEVIQYELLYGKGIEDFQEAWNIADGDIESMHEGDLWRLHWKRKIAGEAFSQFCLASPEPESQLYGVRYELRLEDGKQKDALALTLALYENALEAYGQPSTPPDAPDGIAANLDVIKKGELLDQNFEERWKVGVDSEFTLRSMVDVERAVIFLRYQSKDAAEEETDG